MANNVPITAGAGTDVATVQLSDNSQAQLVQLLIPGTARTTIPADATYGLAVDLKRIDSGVTLTVVQPTAANLKVDASGATVPISAASAIPVSAAVGAPVYVRLSDGSSPISTLPISGTATANQGTPAAASGAWPVKISNGTDTAGISTVGSDKAVKVDVIQTVDPSSVSEDLSSFTEGTSKVQVAAGVYNPTRSGNVGDNQAAAVRVTALGDLQASLVNSSGNEIGTAASPVYVAAATSPGTQVVSGSVTAKLTDDGGTAFSETSPVPVSLESGGRTRVTKEATITASQTAQDVWVPTSGKRFVITSYELALSVGGTLTLFDGTDSAANRVFNGTQPVGSRVHDFSFPWRSAAVNTTLRWTSGTGTTGNLVIHGYETD